MGNFLHFTFIFFHGYRLDTLPVCHQHALGSKDNSVRTTATLTLSSDSSSSILWDGTAFLRVLRWVLQWALLQVPPRTPRRPSNVQSCCACRRWASRSFEDWSESRAYASGWLSPPHFSGPPVSGSRFPYLSSYPWVQPGTDG